MEAGVVIDEMGLPIYWHIPDDRSIAYLPDSRRLWDVIWGNREIVAGFAHSHPGSGEPGPSYEDLTTFAAIEAALGKRLTWWITSSDTLVTVTWIGPEKLDYYTLPQIVRGVAMEGGQPRLYSNEPVWLQRLRDESYQLTEVQNA